MPDSHDSDGSPLPRSPQEPAAASSAAMLPALYDELRRLAAAQLARERPGQTLQPTALVHEAYLRLAHDPGARWESRGHFFVAAARAMRRILIEAARRKHRLRHGGGRARVELDPDLVALPEPREDLLALDDALDRLDALDRRKCDVVHLRYFAGCTIEETATALGVSLTTVKDDWLWARAWLRRDMDEAGGARYREDRTP